MARTYRPMQLHSEVVDRLNEFKERVGNQVFMNPTALGLSVSIGLLLDIEAFCTEKQHTPSFADIKAMAEKYPQRGRKRVSTPASDVDRGHKFEPDAVDPGNVRVCMTCGARFGWDEEIFAQCMGSVTP